MLFFEEGLLFMRGFNQALPRCIVGDEVTRVLKEVHSGYYAEDRVGFMLLSRSGILVLLSHHGGWFYLFRS